ncbi:MAG: galactokinase [Planctomycetota bacterium]
MSLTELVERAQGLFSERFGAWAEVAGVAPGRVEILGNHTDYNRGFVLAAAVDRHVVVAGRAVSGGTRPAGGKETPAPGPTARIYSAAHNAEARFSLAAMERDSSAPWCDYVKGVAKELQETGARLPGFEAAIVGDVPLGAGLSSSAAIEVATAKFLLGLRPFPLPDRELALLCRRAENRFVGAPCGILDPWTSVHGRANALLLLDCRRLSHEMLPLSESLSLVVADTRTGHSLVESPYNVRRAACLRAAEILCSRKSGAAHLCDFTGEELNRLEAHLPPDLRPLARHVILENERVLRGAEALRKNDPELLGRLMSESHASSRERFKNSTPELDLLVELAVKIPGCYGSRLTGAGFGGATIHLVSALEAAPFAEALSLRYQRVVGAEPALAICRAADGARTERILP